MLTAVSLCGLISPAMAQSSQQAAASSGDAPANIDQMHGLIISRFAPARL
jgi:hypothetical protein